MTPFRWVTLQRINLEPSKAVTSETSFTAEIAFKNCTKNSCSSKSSYSKTTVIKLYTATVILQF